MFTILHDLVIKATTEEIYDAVSKPEHLNKWWTLRCEGHPELDTIYQLYFSDEYDWRAVVTNASGDVFELSMKQSSEGWESTKFGFRFVEQEGETRVEFYHSGWMEQSHHYRRTSYCWALLLFGLKNYLEKGISIPFDERG